MNAILLMRLEDMAYQMSLKENSFKENGASVILGIVHLLGQVAVSTVALIYVLIDAANGTVTMILNLNIVLMRYVRVTVNVNVMSLIQALSQNAFVTNNKIHHNKIHHFNTHSIAITSPIVLATVRFIPELIASCR